MAERRIVLSIDGMGCQGCAETVREALEEVPGVARAEVDLDLGRAEVQADETVAPESLVAAVQEAGYGATPRA